jgi:hypothetical protein
MSAIPGKEVVVQADLLESQAVSGFNFIDYPQRIPEASLPPGHAITHAKRAAHRTAAAREHAGRDAHGQVARKREKGAIGEGKKIEVLDKRAVFRLEDRSVPPESQPLDLLQIFSPIEGKNKFFECFLALSADNDIHPRKTAEGFFCGEGHMGPA